MGGWPWGAGWEKGPDITSDSQDVKAWDLGLPFPREQWETDCPCWPLRHVMGCVVSGLGPGLCGCGNMCPGLQAAE